ncbi:EamA family transporter [Arcobacter sp. LA11]|uniref:EamA family transporter n=1 Tax=Arcobacter sp. LA11 TaxID=1898176 RepID=UPI000933609C|nr:EamA family transporter [Arcobacter sp. LA11]
MKKNDLILAVLVTFIWGINFSVIKLGLASLDPFILSGLRFLFCAIPLVFFIKRPQVHLKYIISYGLLFGVGLWGIVSLGIYFGISAGMASLVLQMSIFFTVILASIMLNETIDISKKLAFAIALLGLTLIITVTDGSVTIIGLILVLIAAVSMSFTNIIIKKAGTKNVFSFMVWASLFSPIPLFILGYITQGNIVFTDFFENLDNIAIFSIVFQVYPTTLFGYWIWNSLLHKYPASSVAPTALLVPIFGLLGSYLIFGEEIGFIKILASFIIISALIVNLYGNRIFIKNYEGV